MELLCLVMLVIACLLVIVLSIKQLIWEIRVSRRPHRRWPNASNARYESPLGLVDNPEDEWIEWAIMDDLLDNR